MKKLVLAAVMAVAAMAPYSPAVAGEEAPGPGGFLCSFTTITDPGTEDGSVQTGYINGGPVLGTGTLRCSIQVGVEAHAGGNSVSVEASGTVVVVIGPSVISYVAAADVPVYLCSEWTDAVTGQTVYFHEDPADPTLSHWSSDPSTPCSLATSA